MIPGNFSMIQPFLVRLPKGAGLIEAIGEEMRRRKLGNAFFSVIGALESPVIAFYDFSSRTYENRTLKGLFEIVNCSGNVSQKEGQIFVHAHVVLSGEDYVCLGGHLMQGGSIFAAELFVQPVAGESLKRAYDDETGLFLWTS
jgi:uncharacterized protein